MVRFKTKEIDSYYAANSILNFIDYAESNLHSIGRYNGSLSLYHKCLYIRREDSLLYRHLVAEWLQKNGYNVQEWSA